MAMLESMASVNPQDPVQPPILQSNAQPTQSSLKVLAFVQMASLKSTTFAFKIPSQAVESTAMTMALDSAFVMPVSINSTVPVLLVFHAHHQVQETQKENVLVMLVWPNMKTIAQNVHWEPFLITLLKNVCMFVVKIVLTTLLNKNVPVC